MWTSDGGSKRPALSIGLFTPQVTVTSGSETNLLLGYVDVELDRPTEVKSLKVTLTGTYTAFWMDGNAGQGMRKEYYQNKLFHHDTITLTKNHLETRRTMFSSGSSRRGSRTVPDARAPLELCVRRADREWETVSVESSDGEAEYTSEEGRRVSGVESGGMWSAPTSPPPPPAPSLSGARWTRRQYHDEAEIEADADVPTFAEAMAAPAASFSSSLSGFTLASGKHRFRFNMRLPARMPSTIASAAGGGIQYALAAKLKTRGGLLGLSSYADATCSVRVVNLPSRLAELQTLLPANDEAIFTRQIEDSWWILARLSSCTVSPGDSLQLSVTLAWPEKRAAGKADGAAGSVAQFVEVAGVQMDLVEHTVYRSLASGAVVKKLRAAVASQVSCGTSKSSRGGNGNGSNSSSSSSHSSSVSIISEKAGGMAISGGARQPLSLPLPPPSMFDEDHGRVFQLQVPAQRDQKTGGGVHIDCRSVPICVSHELQMRLQIYDKVSSKMHLVPFHCRIIVVPDAEAFYLPAYTSSSLDARVL
ncbi:hypothetical protein GGH99_000446 [Coemansia sp. RSA 1285]|nr:hypothetical protein GGH99_000446 [Coemansia sp. RSA 1285]